MPPDDWRSVRLGDVIATTVGGGTPSRSNGDYWNGTIPWATVKDFGPRVLLDTKEHITFEGLNNSSSNLVPEDTVVMATRMNVGALFRSGTPMAINQDLRGLFPTPSLSKEYLFYFLQSSGTALSRLATGTTVKGLRIDTLKFLPLALPPLPEQRKIAAILSSVDNAIEKTQAVIGQIQVVKRGLMQELLTKGLPGRHTQFKPTEIGNVPKAWDVLPLRDFVENGPDNGLYRPQSDYGKGVPIVRIDTFNNGDVLRRPTLRRVSLDHAEVSRFMLKPGDILINRVNSMSHLAKCALAVSFDEATVYESNMMRLALDDSLLTKKYGFLWLSSEKVKAYLKRRAKRAVAQASINQTDVLAIPTPCPPREEQQAIAEVIGNTERRLESEGRTLGGVRELRSALMSVLLTGELRVTPDPEPE